MLSALLSIYAIYERYMALIVAVIIPKERTSKYCCNLPAVTTTFICDVRLIADKEVSKLLKGVGW